MKRIQLSGGYSTLRRILNSTENIQLSGKYSTLRSIFNAMEQIQRYGADSALTQTSVLIGSEKYIIKNLGVLNLEMN